MGKVTNIDEKGLNLVHTLKRLHSEAVQGKISGLVAVIEYEDGYELEMPGVFSTDPDEMCQIIGRLKIAEHYFSAASLIGMQEYDQQTE
jgi:hypothetical protein